MSGYSKEIWEKGNEREREREGGEENGQVLCLQQGRGEGGKLKGLLYRSHLEREVCLCACAVLTPSNN